MCDKALDLNWITFKFIPDWFATNKMLEKFDKFIPSNGDKFFHDEDSNTITFLNNDMTFNTNDFNSINLDHGNCEEDDPETVNHVRLMTWYNKFNQRKTCKKNKNRQSINACSMASKKMVGLVCLRR